MPVECPRCLETNPESTLTCACGYDLTALVRRRLVVSCPEEPRGRHREMTYWHFFVGLMLVWIMLSIGEGFRLKLDLAARATSRLVGDSLLIGAADVAGALVAGALAWIGVWVVRAYEAVRYRPCPKRTTLAVTIIAAALIFVVRLFPSGVIMEHVLQGVIILGLVTLAYLAGSRRWWGRW